MRSTQLIIASSILVCTSLFAQTNTKPATDQITPKVRGLSPIRLGGIFYRGLGDGLPALEDSTTNKTKLTAAVRALAVSIGS